MRFAWRAAHLHLSWSPDLGSLVCIHESIDFTNKEGLVMLLSVRTHGMISLR